MQQLAASATAGLCAAAGGLGAARAPLVLPAHSFAQHLSYRTAGGIFLDRLTAYTFQDGPLRGYDVNGRAAVLAAIVRLVDEEQLHPDVPFEAGDGQSPPDYDWLRGGRRVACRGAQLTWNRGNDRWELWFPGIKLPLEGVRDEPPFDELLLAAHSPEGVYIYRHDDLATGVRAPTNATRHHAMTFVGPKAEARWRVAFDAICAKMDRGCTRLAAVPVGDERIARAVAAVPRQPTDEAFTGVPLADCTAATRAELLVSLLERIDRGWLHSDARFDAPRAAGTRDSARRPAPAEYEWLRDGRRVACKVAQLQWDRTLQLWKLQFLGIKLPLEGVRDEPPFDELLLAAYTPAGVHLHRHDLQAGVSTNGKRTAVTGHRIRFYGPRGQQDARVATAALLRKMAATGCTPLAVVSFEGDEGEGDAADPDSS